MKRLFRLSVIIFALSGVHGLTQELFPLFPPAGATKTETAVTSTIKGWQQDCDKGLFANGQPRSERWAQTKVYGDDMSSIFTLKRKNKEFIASLEIPDAAGKRFSKGTLIVIKTMPVGTGGSISDIHLFGSVWTPRAAAIGKLSLIGAGKITTSPDFNYDAFKRSPSVIPFANGYAVNLFGQKLDQPGMVDTTATPSEHYVTDDGRPVYGRLIRMHSGTLEEIVLTPTQITPQSARPGMDHLARALELKAKHDDTGALRELQEGIATTPNNTDILNNLAWLLATCPDKSLRDGKKALEYAKKADQVKPDDPDIMDTMAAAYAATGDFDQAQKWAQKALAWTRNEPERKAIQGEIDNYKQGKGYTQ